jgi:hypothetical protein
MPARSQHIDLDIEADPLQHGILHCHFEPSPTPEWLARFACLLSANSSVLGASMQRVNQLGVTMHCDEPSQEHFIEAAGWCANHANRVSNLRCKVPRSGPLVA